MISSRFNKVKDNAEEQKQMNNQTVANGVERTYARSGECGMIQSTSGEMRRGYEGEPAQKQGVVERIYGSRERLIDGFPPEANQRMNQRDTRVMPPLPVLRGNHHPNFSGVSEVISPIMPSSPISPQQQQRRLAQNYESEILSHQQMQRKFQNQAPEPETPTNYSTARAHLVQTIEGSPQRYPAKSPQEAIYTSGSYFPPQQRRPPPPATKPAYREHRGLPSGQLSQSSSNLVESQEGNLTANLESNGVYISKSPNPKFSQSDNYAYSQNPIYGTRPSASVPMTAEINQAQLKHENLEETETDDDGGFKKNPNYSIRKLESKPEDKSKLEGERDVHEVEVHEKKEQENERTERPSSRNEILAPNESVRNQDNKVSSATSSDYEKATRRSLGQGSSLGDSGRGSAAYSSGRQDSGRVSSDYRDKPSIKDRVDTSAESSDGVKRDYNYQQQKALPPGIYHFLVFILLVYLYLYISL